MYTHASPRANSFFFRSDSILEEFRTKRDGDVLVSFNVECYIYFCFRSFGIVGAQNEEEFLIYI